MLGKSWTYLVVLSHGRGSTGPHLLGIKKHLFTLDMCISTQVCIGLALCKVSYGKELSQYWHAFPHGTDGVRSRCCSESAGELRGLCLQWVWFGWEKHPAGRWEPEHIGRLVPNGTLVTCRIQVKTHGQAG